MYLNPLYSYCQRIERPDFWGGESELLVSILLCTFVSYPLFNLSLIFPFFWLYFILLVVTFQTVDLNDQGGMDLQVVRQAKFSLEKNWHLVPYILGFSYAPSFMLPPMLGRTLHLISFVLHLLVLLSFFPLFGEGQLMRSSHQNST